MSPDGGANAARAEAATPSPSSTAPSGPGVPTAPTSGPLGDATADGATGEASPPPPSGGSSRPASTYREPPPKKEAEKGRFAAPELAPDLPVKWPSLRAPVAMWLILVLLTGVIYPGAVTLIANEVDPVSPTYLSTLLGENISNPALFWERPSMIDWIPVWNDSLGNGAGDEEPQYPTNPALVNQTLSYIYQYNLTHATVPLDLVSPSASGLDPDIYPDAALIQVPRVCAETGLSLSTVWGMVNDTVTPPVAGFIGPSYVNVVSLDTKLLALPQMAGTTPNGSGAGN